MMQCTVNEEPIPDLGEILKDNLKKMDEDLKTNAGLQLKEDDEDDEDEEDDEDDEDTE